MSSDGVSRREFVTVAAGAAVGALVAGQPPAAAQGGKRRYAIVGTGVRAIGMWGRPILRDYGDIVELVGLCDINPLRVEVAKRQMGVSCPTFTNFDDMLAKARPDLLMVTTVDAFHSQYLVRAMERGIDVMTEKPMVIDETAVQGGARRREEDRPQDRRHPQLPLRAQAPEDQGTADGRRDRQDHVGRLQLVPRHLAWRRLLPPLAPAARQGRVAVGAQGESPLRPR